MSRPSGTWLPVALAAILVSVPLAATDDPDRGSPAPRVIDLPVQPWHDAGEGKSMVGLSYSVNDAGKLTISYTVEEIVPSLGVVVAASAAEDGGLIVERVQPDSGADRAGLQVGDALLSVNGASMATRNELRSTVRKLGSGAEAEIRYRRDGAEATVTAKIHSSVRRSVDLRTSTLKVVVDERHTGLAAADVTGKAASDLIGEGRTGIVVVNTLGGTPAFYSEIRRGDIVTSVDGIPVTTVSEFIAMSEERAARKSSMQVGLRRGSREFGVAFVPARNLEKSFSFEIPIVLDWEISPKRTDFDLGTGLVLDYDRNAEVTASGNHVESRKLGLVLDIIKYESSPEGKKFSILWLFRLNW